jgi:hypothetical protein
MQNLMRGHSQRTTTDKCGSAACFSKFGETVRGIVLVRRAAAFLTGFLGLVTMTPLSLAGQDADSSSVSRAELLRARPTLEGYGGFSGFTSGVLGVGVSYPLAAEWYVYTQVSAVSGDDSGWLADLGIGARIDGPFGLLSYVRLGARGLDLSDQSEGEFEVRPVTEVGFEVLKQEVSKQRVRPFASWAITWFEWRNLQTVIGVRLLLGS